MIRRQLTEGKIALCKQMLLYSSVAESMERVQGCVQVHLPQPHLEPRVELVALDDLETSVTVRNLEDRSVAVKTLAYVKVPAV